MRTDALIFIGTIAMNRFRDQLRRQLGFLESSCATFDAGKQDEAIRIATSIRVILYDPPSNPGRRNQSVSLLTHLGSKNIDLLTTVPDVVDPGPYKFFDGLTTFSLAGPQPKLGNSVLQAVAAFAAECPDAPFVWRPPVSALPVNTWWDQVVYILGRGKFFRRRDLVLTAANKDGGAHVDADLTPEYEKVSTLWAPCQPGHPIGAPFQNIHLIGLRQFGYELLHSEQLTALAPA